MRKPLENIKSLHFTAASSASEGIWWEAKGPRELQDVSK
jgi:hypothetical protein